MFSGIVEETGTVRAVRPSPAGIRLVVAARRTARLLRKGGSLAVNGCCLTAVALAPKGRETWITFDLLEETWRRTNLQFARPGAAVNLERPLRMGAPLDGHFVTGHVDGLGSIVLEEKQGADWRLDIAAPPDLRRYCIEKGSVAVDGISLTIAAVARKSFTVWIIPHTWAVTALRERKQGDWVNLEADLLGKYVERFMGAYGPRRTGRGGRA